MNAEPAAVTPVFEPPRANRWLSSPWPLLFGLCAIAALWLLAFGNPFETLEMRWMGQVLRWRYDAGSTPPSDPHIVHLDITRTDLQRMPSLESEYQKAADLIRMATDLGARVVAFDVVFGRGNEAMNAPILAEAGKARAQNRSVVFAEALIPKAGVMEVERIRSFPAQERQRPAGLINVKADTDGVFRHYELARRAAENYEPSLALAAYLAWREVPWDGGVTYPTRRTIRWEEIGPDFTSMQAHDLRVTPVLLNMRAPWTGSGSGAFRHLTVAQFEELYARRAELTTLPLDNAIVFVSYTGTGLGDVGTTALAPNQPRVLLHSSALNDLIQGAALHRWPRWADLLALAGVVLLGGAATFLRRTTPLILFWAVVLVAIGAIGAWLIVQIGSVAPVVLAGSLWTVTTAAEMGRRYSNELIERLKLRTTMSLYFSPRVMEQVLKNPGSMDPQQVEVTVLLTDVRNSTPIAERLGPAGMFGLLNQIFEAQTRAILAEDGSMEHFLGDQFLSYWGAPNPQRDAPDRAFRGALALIAGMEEVRPKLDPRITTLFGYGVALHSGIALIGNKGSAQRLDYGLVGDLINSAARVESLTKHYGVLFLITRDTYAKLSAPPMTRIIDKAVAKGTGAPLELLEVRHPLSSAAFEEIAERYNVAFADYERGDFGTAEAKFSVLRDEQNDRPSALMAERCAELRAAPPPDWSGVYEFKTK